MAPQTLPPAALIVEDEPDLAELFVHRLTRLGYRCIVLDNAEDAVGCLTNTRFNLAIIDLMLPDMNGDQLIHHIRTTDQTTLPIVLTSIIDRHAQPETDADAWLNKPFNHRAFQAAIRTALTHASTRPD